MVDRGPFIRIRTGLEIGAELGELGSAFEVREDQARREPRGLIEESHAQLLGHDARSSRAVDHQTGVDPFGRVHLSHGAPSGRATRR